MDNKHEELTQKYSIRINFSTCYVLHSIQKDKYLNPSLSNCLLQKLAQVVVRFVLLLKDL